jgi:transposase
LLLPPALQDWLPRGHLVYFVSDTVDALDLSAIYAEYDKELRGYPPYHPAMLVKVLFYGLCKGVFSSRRLAVAVQEDIGFRVLGAGNEPDFRTISDFRKRHLETLAQMFVQVLKLCQKAGLAPMKHVALDGTKLQANASKHSAMSYDRLVKEEQRLTDEIKALLKKGQDLDESEDSEFGSDLRGDELPGELSFREGRLAKIREAKAALEQEAKERAEAKEAERAQSEAEQAASGKKRRGKKLKPVVKEPKEKAQRNFTDPESRIMKDSNQAYIQGYNGQAAVDAEHQIIVACDLTNMAADTPHLSPMVDRIESNTGRLPDEISADAGYFSDMNIKLLEEKRIDGYVPPDRQRHGKTPTLPSCLDPKLQSAADRQRAKLCTEEGRERYSLRKETVEPVFGQTKFARGFRQFLLRGIDKAKSEWALVCLGHNLLKLYRYG